ncbi:MAG: flagellar biosynthesis protein FliQ [Gammaproteobacteria bacterium]|nr:flagellar biosynthesis protein FliQ [Gammaproteobacteria bacterium]
MSSDLALMLSKDMLWTAIIVAVPILGLSMLVGLLISIFQVVTQIQEMSLTFVPKILTVALTLIVLGPWMLGVMLTYSSNLIRNIPQYF